MKITIDGDTYEDVEVRNGGYLPMVTCGRLEFYVAESSEDAGLATRKYWEEMKDDDKREFCAIIGEERLVQWACGESDSFGISSFDDFLDAIERVPEEQFAGYDGCEREVESADEELIDELGFTPTVAYRHN